MIRLFSIIFFTLISTLQIHAGESWKLISRSSFYTSEKVGEMLLHVPDEQLHTSFNISLEIDGKTVLTKDIEAAKSIVSVTLSLDKLSVASHKLVGKIKSDGLSVVVNSDLVILKPKANSVKIDRLTGGLLVNDLPYFPFGFYCYSPVQPTLPEEEVVKGFNMMSPYQKIEVKTREERRAYLDRAAGLGMKVHYNLLSVSGGGGVGSGRDKNSSQSEKEKLLKEEIEAFMDHPALLAWYISDEPTGHGADPEELKKVYEFIKAIDPYHPITIVFMAPMQARRYADAMDIVMADPYPIPNNTPEGVGYVTRNLLNEFRGEKAVWIVPQAFGGSEWWGREPSIQELRGMTYLSLANGATGIQYFVRHGFNGFPKSTATWGMAAQIALETNEIAPFILAGKISDIAETDQENIHLRSWEKDGQTLIMAVNESIEPGPLKIDFNDLPDVDIQVLFENRKEEISGGLLNDFIDGYGRRVYLLGENTTGKIKINPRNIILDPGFEDLASPGVPASCYARVGKDRGATYFTDSRVSVEGRHSIRINSPSANNESSLGFFPVMVNSGSGYTLSVWAKYDPASFRAEAPKGFWKRLFKKDPDPNRYFTIGLGSIKSETFTLTNEWKKYSLTVYIPEDSEESSRINPSLTMISQGTAWFDALEMYPDPVIEYGVNTESRSFEVKVVSDQENAKIRYTLDGNIPSHGSTEYKSAVQLHKSATFTAGVFLDDSLYNYSSKSFFVHLATGKKVDYFRKYVDQYSGGGEFGLVDGIRGSRNYTDKLWQGFMGNNLLVTIDLEKSTSVSSVKVGCLQDTRSWIFMPRNIIVYGSQNGEDFITLAEIQNDISQKAVGSIRKDYVLSFDTREFRYIKVAVNNIGICPEWHNGKGSASFLFVDEIMIN